MSLTPIAPQRTNERVEAMWRPSKLVAAGTLTLLAGQPHRINCTMVLEHNATKYNRRIGYEQALRRRKGRALFLVL